MKIPLLIGLSGIMGAVIAAQVASAGPLLDAHAKKLQAAASFEAQYTVQNLPGAPVEYKLKLGKKGKFRLESQDEVVVADGTTVWDYKKADNNYTQAAQTEEDLKNFLKKDAVLAWASFFVKDAFKDTGNVKVGAKRILKGKAVTEVSLALAGKPERTATYFVDQELGVARGISIQNGEKQSIIMAKELKFSDDAPADSDFAFSIPDGAKKVDPTLVASVSFDKVAGIFMNNCGGCHSANGGKAGLDLTTYQGVMTGSRRGKVIVPGDPDASSLMGNLKGTRKIMPPGGALASSDIDAIAGWIKAGAKEK